MKTNTIANSADGAEVFRRVTAKRGISITPNCSTVVKLALVSFVLTYLLVPAPAPAANIWDGGGANANWDTVANWDDNTLPLTSANVTIGTGYSSGSAIDLNGARTVNSLTVSTSGSFSLNDDSLTLTSGNFSRSGTTGGTATIISAIVLGANGLWNISAPSSPLFFNGAIGDAGNNFGIHFTPGASRVVTLAGNNTFDGDLQITNTGVIITGDNSARSGDTILHSGTLTISNANALGSGSLIFDGGTLQLGTAANVTITNDWQILPGATFGYTGNGSGTTFIMSADLTPLTGDVTFRAMAGGGSSRAIIVQGNITESVSSSLIVSGGDHGTNPRFNGSISLSGDIIVKGTGGQTPRLVLAGDNSGTTGDLIVDGSVSSAFITLLNPAALTSGTFIINASANESSLADDGVATTKTFAGALQWGGTIDLDQKDMKFTGNMLLTDNLTFQTGPSNGILELAGNIGDGGNVFGIHMDPEDTRTGRLILSGTNTFTGELLAEGGPASGNAIVQLDGSLARANITLGVRGTLQGSGTIFFQDGDLIDVGGTLNASALTFDLTGHSAGLYTIVDYSSGTFTGPGTINNLLSSASLSQGWSLTNTGTQITAFLEIPPAPEPSTLCLLGLGAVVGARKRRNLRTVV